MIKDYQPVIDPILYAPVAFWKHLDPSTSPFFWKVATVDAEFEYLKKMCIILPVLWYLVGDVVVTRSSSRL